MKTILKSNDVVYGINYDVLDEIGLPPITYNGPEYYVRALNKYCKENNRSPETLTDEELKQFEVK